MIQGMCIHILMNILTLTESEIRLKCWFSKVDLLGGSRMMADGWILGGR